MAGDNVVVGLRKTGLDVAGSTGLTVDPNQIYFPPAGHPLFDRRSLDPVDERMAQAIVSGKFKPVVGVRRDGLDPKTGYERLTLVWGNTRTLASIRAQEIQEGNGVPIEKQFRVGAQILHGSDREMMEAKIAENGGRKDETPGSLCDKFRSLEHLGGSIAEGAALYRIPMSLAEFVVRHEEQPERVQAAFESRRLPLQVLPYFFSTVPESREALLDTILASGAVLPEEIEKVARTEKAKVQARARKVRVANGSPLRAYAMPAKIVRRVVNVIAEDSRQKVQLARAVILWQRGDKATLRKLDEGVFDTLESALVAHDKGDKTEGKGKGKGKG